MMEIVTQYNEFRQFIELQVTESYVLAKLNGFVRHEILVDENN